MTRINTGSIPALMVKLLAFWNRPDENLVGNYMRFADAEVSWFETHNAISKFMAMSSPLPAFRLLVDCYLH